MEEQQEQQLCLINQSLTWLLVVVLGVLLSLWATLRQRAALCLAIAGETEAAAEAAEVYPIRNTSSVLIVLALTFFFLVTLCGGEQAEASGDPRAIRSSCLNRWAALLVLAAAVLRLWDVNEVHCGRTADE